jgi:hypothetical protein
MRIDDGANPGVQERKMEKKVERSFRHANDTFIVRREDRTRPSSASELTSSTDTITMPGGRRVHALERKVFERAVRAAMGKTTTYE